MMGKLRLAILGAGHIAETMATTVCHMETVELYAVAAREESRARAFAEKYGAKRYYGSYEEMLRDDQVELVYIATPHSHHAAHAKLCIEHRRPVLCEKAFTTTAAEAAEVLQLAKERGVFLAEAMWVRYMPMSVMLREAIDAGKIGTVTALTANLGYSVLHKERLARPELGGGALLDLGVYTLNFATWLLGDEPERIETTVVPLETQRDEEKSSAKECAKAEGKSGACGTAAQSNGGTCGEGTAEARRLKYGIDTVDKQEIVTLVYPGGVVASLFNTMAAVTDRKGFVYGTEGHIEVENVNNYEEFRIYNNRYELVETVRRPEQITGYEYEVEACRRALEAGQLECEEMPHAHTLNILRITDAIVEQWNAR